MESIPPLNAVGFLTVPYGPCFALTSRVLFSADSNQLDHVHPEPVTSSVELHNRCSSQFQLSTLYIGEQVAAATLSEELEDRLHVVVTHQRGRSFSGPHEGGGVRDV